MPDAASAARGVYKPRRPQASPLSWLVSDHLHRLQTVYDERLVRDYGPWRPVVAQVADKFLACGVLDHGFARIRRDDCAHEYLLAFSSKCRYCCPRCHAKRLAIWTPEAADTPPLIIPAPRPAPTEATRLWADLLRHIFEVDPIACPTCHGPIRVVAFFTTGSSRISGPAPRARRGGLRSPPWTRAPGQGRVTRTARRHPDCRLSTVPSPRHHAGTFAVGGSPTGASDLSPPASPPHWNRRSHGPRGACEAEGTPPPVCR